MPKTGFLKRVGEITYIKMRKIFFAFLFVLGTLASFSRAASVNVSPTDKMMIHPPKAPVGLIDIFATLDKKILGSGNEGEAKNYLIKKNGEILDYIIRTYPSLTGELEEMPDVNDNATTLFGLICAIYEANNFEPFPRGAEPSQNKAIPEWLECTFGVLGTVAGVSQLLQELGTFSWGSTWKLVKFIVKKYGLGWFATIGAIYEVITTCF